MRQRLLFAALYFSEGAPIGFIWWALPTRLRAEDVAVADITALTSLLALPWALKFVWAPVVDALRSRRFSLVSWIVCAQVMMGLTLVPLLFLDLRSQFALVYGLLVAHALAAATQDVAVDALCIASVPDDQRGRINGWMQAGMLTARALFGGVLLLVGTRLGFAYVVAALIASVWGSLALLLWLRPRGDAAEPPADARATGSALWQALRTPSTYLALAFAATAGAAFEGVGGVAGPLMLDRGLSTDAIGVFFAAVGVVSMVLGGLAGGYLADRRSLLATVAGGQLFLGAGAIVLAALDWASLTEPAVLYVGLAMIYAGIGVFTAASYALFMRLAQGAARATVFSAFMGMTNLCEMWATRSVGAIHRGHGYASAFCAVGLVTLLALTLLPALARRAAASRRYSGRATTRAG